MARFTIDIPDSLKNEFKSYCSANALSMKHELNFMIDDYLRKHKARGTADKRIRKEKARQRRP